MRNLILIFGTMIFICCGHEYDNTTKQRNSFKARDSQPYDTLICKFVSNTESLDLYILQGSLTLPTDIKQQLSDSLTRDIKVCGNFPKDLINMQNRGYDPGIIFKIVGKTISADSENAIGKVPLFYVTKWEKIKKTKD